MSIAHDGTRGLHDASMVGISLRIIFIGYNRCLYRKNEDGPALSELEGDLYGVFVARRDMGIGDSDVL